MPHRAHRPVTLLLATACLALAGAAQAQSAPQTAPAGPRYMTWANRPATTTPGDVVAAQTRARNGMIPRRVAPTQALSRPMMQQTPQATPTSRGLTPASAWLGPRVAPSFAPGSPDPMAYATSEMTSPSPIPTYSAPTPAPARMPALAPAPVYAPPPTPAPSAAPARMAEAAPVSDPARDPMAPRRDAPIFRLQQPGGAPAPQAAADMAQPAPQTYAQAAPAPSGQQGARYYSLHRDAGHAPDPTVMPEPVYFDSVTLDLAEPPANEAPTRDAQGRRRPAANEDPSLP